MSEKTHILVVDDDKNIQKTLADILKARGYAPLIAASGEAALELVAEETPAVALIDLRLEDISGLELMGKIKGRAPDVECIVLTGHTSQESAIEAVKLGAYSYMVKPYKMDELLLTVRRAVEKRNMEEALRESQELYNLAVGAANLGIYDTRTRDDELQIGESWFKKLGYDRTTVAEANITWESMVHPEDIDRILSQLDRVINGEKDSLRLEYRIRAGDGEWRWILDSGKVTERGPDGKAERLIGTHLDISERKRAEEALREERDKAQKYLDIAGVLFLATDMDEKVILINKKGCEVLGAGEEEIIGKNWHDTFIPQDIREEVKGVFDRLTAGEIQAFEYYENPVVRLDGEERLIAWHNTILRDDADNITGMLSSGDDITERRQTEEALVASQKMAGMGTLAAGIAHEINSPLQMITGLSERHIRYYQKGQLDEKQLPVDLDTINRNAWRIAKIVRSLLTYARPAMDQSDSNDLTEIVEDTLLLIEHRLKTWSNIIVEKELAQGLPLMHCDRNSITQVLINLMSNAADAMPQGGKMTIRTRHDNEKKRLLMQVSDTGGGIPDEARARIFDPFFTTKDVGEGTGLGLSIVSGIVQSHGGEIEVDSAPKQGTTFSVYFPEIPPLMTDAEKPSNEQGRYDKGK